MKNKTNIFTAVSHLFSRAGKKPLFAQIVLLIMLLGVIFFLKLSFYFSDKSSHNLATLVINFENEKRYFEGDVISNMTVLDALSAAVSTGKIKLAYSVDKSGNVDILELGSRINGVGGEYLVFYLNDKKIATKDLNKKVIRNGDRIEIKNE